jgi:hypothetical protein
MLPGAGDREKAATLHQKMRAVLSARFKLRVDVRSFSRAALNLSLSLHCIYSHTPTAICLLDPIAPSINFDPS